MLLYRIIMLLSRVIQSYGIIIIKLLSMRKRKNYAYLQRNKNYAFFRK